MLITRALVVGACLALVSACSGTDSSGRRGGDGDGDGGGLSGGDGDGVFDNGGTGGVVGGTGSLSGTAALIPDDGTCDRISVSASKADPEFLIVLDKSGSMGGENHPACMAMAVDCTNFINMFLPQCLGVNVDRWTPSVTALSNITAMLDATIPFGLMMYPSDNQCGVGGVNVPIGLGTSGAIKGVFDQTCPQGRTPTAAALLAARDEFMARTSAPDAAPTAPYVLLVTDGAPNCDDSGNPDQDTWDAVDMLAAAGIRTYVIGYDTQSDPQLAQVLDEAARRGNTGDQAHRPVEDEASLTAEFTSIAMNAVSCTYVLNQEVKDAAYVLVKLDGVQKNLGDPNGWELGSDNVSVSLQGDACNALQDGGGHLLDITVECQVVVPQ